MINIIKLVAITIGFGFFASSLQAQSFYDFQDPSKNLFKEKVVFELRTKYDVNLCMAIKGGNTIIRSQIITLYCNGQDYQKWVYRWSDNTIRSKLDNNICIVASDINENNPDNIEASLTINTCNYPLDQQWGINEEGVIYLASNPNLVIDVKGFEFGINIPLILFPYKNTDDKNTNQHWEIREE